MLNRLAAGIEDRIEENTAIELFSAQESYYKS
jgi:hypothetical protein